MKIVEIEEYGGSTRYRTGDELTLEVEFSHKVKFASTATGQTQGSPPQQAILKFSVETGDSDMELRGTVYSVDSSERLYFTGSIGAIHRSNDLGYAAGKLVSVMTSRLLADFPGS